MARARIRGPLPPEAPAIELERAYREIARAARRLIEGDLLPAYERARARRGDADGGSPMRRELSSVLSGMARAMLDRVPRQRLEGATASAGAMVDATHREAFDRRLSEVLGLRVQLRAPRVPEELSAWVQEATDKIVSVRDDAIPGIRAAVENAWRRGRGAEELARTWRDQGLPLKGWGTVEGRARVIARDQLGKLNARLTEQRQRALGVEAYTWRTTGDSRVRHQHRARNGRRFLWSKPPQDGHPGEPVLCRCVAEAIVDLDEVARRPEVQLPSHDKL